MPELAGYPARVRKTVKTAVEIRAELWYTDSKGKTAG
jgi:hypothetical protein